MLAGWINTLALNANMGVIAFWFTDGINALIVLTDLWIRAIWFTADIHARTTFALERRFAIATAVG